jgi:hypothetical protein
MTLNEIDPKKLDIRLPHLYFFRHIDGRSSVQIGQKFGQRYLRKYWARPVKI